MIVLRFGSMPRFLPYVDDPESGDRCSRVCGNSMKAKAGLMDGSDHTARDFGRNNEVEKNRP